VKKFFLGSFILLDLAVMAASAYVLYTYVSQRMSRHVAIPSAGVVPAPPPLNAGTPSAGAVPASATAIASASAPLTQTKMFSYRNSHAKHVAIRADFTGWKAETMQRDSAGVWTYKAVLSPGEYAYCFSVDDKPPLKDPVNKRTKLIGKAVVSAIVVEAASPKPPK